MRPIAKDHLSHTKECQKFFERLALGAFEAFTSTFVLAEIQWTLEGFFRLPKEEILEALFGLHTIPHLTIIDAYQTGVALGLYEKHHVKFIDTLIASHPLIYRQKLAVVSYDKEFDRLGVLRKQPSEIV